MPINRSVGLKAKPTKPVTEVLRPVVAKYGLHLSDLVAKIVSPCQLVGWLRSLMSLKPLYFKEPACPMDECHRVEHHKPGAGSDRILFQPYTVVSSH